MQNRDLNSLDTVMGELYRSFVNDLENITGCDFSRESLRVSRILAEQGRVGFLSFLEKHHKVLLWRLKEPTSTRHDDVAADKQGHPLFFNPLWRDLASPNGLQACSCLRQAFCLFRKWKEDDVPKGASSAQFIDRMNNQKVHLLSAVDQVAYYLPEIIGNDDLVVDKLPWPLITSGARATKTPVLQRIDTMQWMSGAEVFRLDGFVMAGENRSQRINRLVEVPKTWQKNRLVFAEPTHCMNLQQSCRQWIEARVSRHSRTRIRFDEQEHQQRSLRLEGRASIDLSDASDYLSVGVIWRFFAKYPVLRAALFWGRSTNTLVCDEQVSLRCFGTIGNATTFTVMTVFLACLTKAAEVHCRRYSGRRVRPSTIFGDDIVCDDFIAGSVLMYLRDVGLVPNGDKTFIATHFRESCGLDIYDGQDVTPLYVKRVRVHAKADIIRIIQQSNQAHRAGLWRLAKRIADLSPRQLTVNVDEASLTSFTPGECTFGAKWDRHLQKWQSPYKPVDKIATEGRDSHLDLSYWLSHGSRVRAACPAAVRR